MILRMTVLLAVASSFTSLVQAQEVLFREDFDGDSVQPSLVIGEPPGSYELGDGQWIWNAEDVTFMNAHVAHLGADYSITTQVQTLDTPPAWKWLGVYARGALDIGSEAQYWGGISSQGQLSIGYFDGASITIADEVNLGLNTDLGVNLQFDVQGDTMKLWGWHAGTELAEPIWLPGVELGLRLREGSYEGHQEVWLRWVDASGQPIPTGADRAEQQQQRAECLADQLRRLGQQPDA